MNLALFFVHLGYLGSGMFIIRLMGFSAENNRLRRFLTSYVIGLVTQIVLLYAVAAVGPVPHRFAFLLSAVGLMSWVYFVFRSWRTWRLRWPEGANGP